jgi:diguanylate cyclase (GGDEF)-like protein
MFVSRPAMLTPEPASAAALPEDAWALFELAPTSLWLEDFSALAQLYASWRAQGVTDLRAHLTAQPERVVQCTRCIRVLKVNQSTLSLFGASSQEELLAHLPGLLGPQLQNWQIHELEQLWLGQLCYEHPLIHSTLDGRRLDVQLRVRILPGHELDWARVLVSIEDHSEREHARRDLQLSQQYAQGLFENSPVSLWVEDFSEVHRLMQEVRASGVQDFRVFTDVHPEFVARCMAEIRVLDVNQQTLKLFAAPDKATLLQRLPDVFRDEMRRPFTEQLIDLWHGRLYQQRETVNYALDGELCHVHMQFAVLPGHERDWSLVQVSLTDISARKKAEAYLEYLGKHDVLTKLRNRSYFMDEVGRLERKGSKPVSLIMIDLNGLKAINDECGHASGDALLRRMGEVLGKAVDPSATVARTGGDEFVVLLPGRALADAQRLADQIQKIAQLNNQFHGEPALSLSLGVAETAVDERIEQALHRADLAMYHQKSQYYAALGGKERRGGAARLGPRGVV